MIHSWISTRLCFITLAVLVVDCFPGHRVFNSLLSNKLSPVILITVCLLDCILLNYPFSSSLEGKVMLSAESFPLAAMDLNALSFWVVKRRRGARRDPVVTSPRC